MVLIATVITWSLSSMAAEGNVTNNSGRPDIPQEAIDSLADQYPNEDVTIINYMKTAPDSMPYLSLNQTLTREFSTSETFVGPPEESSSNSREYRVKMFQDEGTYYGQGASDMGSIEYESGTWTNPTYYLEYTVDYSV